MWLLEVGGAYRELYTQEALELKKLEGKIPEHILIEKRALLKAKYQKITPPEVERALKAVFGSGYDKKTPTRSVNPSKTNVMVNRVGKVGKWSGRVLLVIMVNEEYKKIKTSKDWARQLGSSSSGIIGSVTSGWLAGAGAGFALTAGKAHPWIIFGGTLLGGLIGGAIGYDLFSGAYEKLYDIVTK